MKFAVIDIGSNTAKAEIYKYKNGRLDLDGKYIERDMIADHKDGGFLDDAGIQILINIMNKFRIVCAGHGVKKIFPYATQSLRGINNADEVLKKIKQHAGLDVKIITGQQEARLCFESFKADGGAENGVLSDLGGGSTELNFIKDGELVKSVSLPFGSRSLCHDMNIGIMPDEEQEKRISDIITSYKKEFDLENENTELFACGGSAHGMFKLYSAVTGGSGYEADLFRISAFYNTLRADKEKAEKYAKELTPQRYDTVITGIYAHMCLCSALGCAVINRCRSTCRKGYAAKLVRDGYVR
ncbi:MAG: hypothetical protein IJT49_08365 [Clostridia bacterium]|nr:hypothetical protein [Clostridia bacterium]